MELLDIQQGAICPRCVEKRRSGVMIVKSGKFGKFLGCDKYPLCTHTEDLGVNLETLATQILKGKRSKTRRAKRKNKRLAIEKKIELAQRKERGQMFRDFERLIGE